MTGILAVCPTLNPHLPDVSMTNGKQFTPNGHLQLAVGSALIRKILEAQGFGVQVEKTSNWQQIMSDSNGTIFFVRLHGAGHSSDTFKALTFHASYFHLLEGQEPLIGANEFNRKFRFARVIVESPNQVRIQWDLNIGNGASIDQLKEWLSTWRAIMDLFEDFWHYFTPKNASRELH